MDNAPKFMTIREVARTGLVPEHYLRSMVASPGIYAGKKFMVNFYLLVEQLDMESRKAVNAQ